MGERSSEPPSHHFFPLPRWPEGPLLFLLAGTILRAPVSSLLPFSSVARGPAAILAGGSDPPGPRLITSSLFLGGRRARCYFGWRERSSVPPSHCSFPLPPLPRNI